MNTITKSIIFTGGLLALVSVPLTVGAVTSIFSGKGAYGSMYGLNVTGTLSFDVRAFQIATMTKQNKTTSSGVRIIAGFVDYEGINIYCWNGYGETNTFQFNTIPPSNSNLPKQVTASGSVQVEWYEFCSGNKAPFTETVTFNMDLSALTDKASSDWGSLHNDYGYIKANSHYDNISAPAVFNASSISSPAFGTATTGSATVGQSKGYEVQITR